jgi:hypothetical protein
MSAMLPLSFLFPVLNAENSETASFAGIFENDGNRKLYGLIHTSV